MKFKMAYTSSGSGAPHSWNRWAEQPTSPEYTMVDNPPFVSYDDRTATPINYQRHNDSPHFMAANAYTVAPSMTMPAPAMSMPAPHFHNQQFSMGCVTPSTSAGVLPSFRSYHEERPRICVDDQDNSAAMQSIRLNRYPNYTHEQRSPSVKSEHYTSQTVSPVSTPASTPTSMRSPIMSKTITPNTVANAENQAEFHTEVDVLMKCIQAEAQKGSSAATAQGCYPSPPSEMESRGSSPDMASLNVRDSRKRYVCNMFECGKRFAQKTHLVIHQRSHNGEKPYICKQAGCGERFTQLGNLKTHERRHTGERPYRCEICNKAFAQRGNVKAHKQTHEKQKRFLCKLDGCTKDFTQLGNMKTHQNRFHAETIKQLTSKFAAMISAGEDIEGSDKDLFDYFAIHYKNTNKGIKGRGKNRKVGVVQPALNSSIPSHYPIQPAQELQEQQPLPQHMHHALPSAGMSYPSAFGHWSSPNMLVGRDHRRGYEMYENHDEAPFSDRFPERMY